MLFSSVPFLFYFLPAVLLVYFLVPRFLKNTVLLLSSLVFYGWGEPKLLFLMIFTISVFYLCGLAIGRAGDQKWKKFWLWISVVVRIVQGDRNGIFSRRGEGAPDSGAGILSDALVFCIKNDFSASGKNGGTANVVEVQIDG